MWYLVSRANDNMLSYVEYTTFDEARKDMEEEFDDSNPVADIDEIHQTYAYNISGKRGEEWLICGGHEYYKVVIYRSSIPNYPLSEDEDDNLFELIIPDYIMKKWFESKKEFKGLDLDYWYKNLSEADMTTDLYEFCMSQKYIPGILL